jgi:hypothetical protein
MAPDFASRWFESDVDHHPMLVNLRTNATAADLDAWVFAITIGKTRTLWLLYGPDWYLISVTISECRFRRTLGVTAGASWTLLRTGLDIRYRVNVTSVKSSAGKRPECRSAGVIPSAGPCEPRIRTFTDANRCTCWVHIVFLSNTSVNIRVRGPGIRSFLWDVDRSDRSDDIIEIFYLFRFRKWIFPSNGSWTQMYEGWDNQIYDYL